MEGAVRRRLCKPNTNNDLQWAYPLTAIRNTFYVDGIRLNPGVDPPATGFAHSYTTNEIITTGTSRQQLVSLIGGDGGANDKVNKAGRSTMINYQIARIMSQPGFAFISAGYNGIEEEPVALSNLRITSSSGNNKGTILLRKNIFYASECGNQIREFRTTYQRSPISGTSQNGGLTIFPAKFPSDLGSHPKNTGTLTTKGTLMLRKGDNANTTTSQLGPGGIYEFNDIYLLPGSKLEVDTSKPVTLKVKGDIHISPGAKLCNVTAFGSTCGSGKASNLTIIQGSTADANKQITDKLQCDIDAQPNYTHTGEAKPIGTDGTTFTVQGTGKNGESMNAFIFTPASTFVSAGVAKSSRNQDAFNGYKSTKQVKMVRS